MAAALCILSLVASSLVLAQNSVQLLPQSASSSFPACALSCSVLISAQDGCVPPAAPVSNQATYVSCFCQSALIASLHTSSQSVCLQECPAASDRALLQSWYNNFCASHGSPAQSAPPSSSSPSAAPAKASSSASPSWISTHYRWVIMIVALAIGFTLAAMAGIWLKRRYDSKYPAIYHGPAGGSARASKAGALASGLRTSHGEVKAAPQQPDGSSSSSAALPDMWGPHQSMAHPRVVEESIASSSTRAGIPRGNVGPSQKPPADMADDEIREI